MSTAYVQFDCKDTDGSVIFYPSIEHCQRRRVHYDWGWYGAWLANGFVEALVLRLFRPAKFIGCNRTEKISHRFSVFDRTVNPLGPMDVGA